MGTKCENGFRLLAGAVINLAIKDCSGIIEDINDKDILSAKRFLNNSRELEMYADMANCREEMEKLGYLHA